MARFFSIIIFFIALLAYIPFLYSEEEKTEEADKIKMVEKLDKKKLIEEIEQKAGWSYEEHKDYLFLSDYLVGNTNKDLFNEIEFLLPIYSAYYPFEKKEDLNVIRVFNDHKDYINYVGKYKYYITESIKVKIKGGYLPSLHTIGEKSYHVSRWYPKTKELVILIGRKLPRKKKDYNKKLDNIITPSLFSQFTYSHSSCSSASVWFIEGNVEFFRGIEQKGRTSKRYTIDISNHKIKEFRKAQSSKSSLKLDNILTMNIASYLGKESEERYSNNLNVWALMYYLQKGAPSTKKYEYALIPLKYMNALRNETDPAKATEIAWEGIDKNKFEKDFMAFWKKKSLINSSKRYDPIKDHKLKKIKADFLKKETEK